MTPAKVRFTGDVNDYRLSCGHGDTDDMFCSLCSRKDECEEEFVSLFTEGVVYEAFFVEYWEGIRDSLHVRANDGKIHDFVSFGDFEVVEDPDDLLNMYEAEVRCATHRFDGFLRLAYGKTYKAIGCDKDRFYLVMDESYCCYYYPAEDFEVVSDPHHILERQSVYRNYYGNKNEERVY